MLRKPLVVYLDSSDISDLSNPLKRTDELIKVEAELIDLQSRGLIEFRFSMIHILEAAPKDEKSLIFAKQRLNYIYKLCGRKCIVSYVDILENEIANLCEETNHNHIELYNDHSIWFPELDRHEEVNLQSMIEEHINSLSDRAQKRRARQKLLTKEGIVRAEVLLNINLYFPAVISEITDKYPLTYSEASSYFKALVKGENLANETILKSFSEIERLPEWYEKQWDRVIPTSSYLRDIGQRIKATFQNLQEQSRTIFDKMHSSGDELQQIKNKQNELIENSLVTLPHGLAKRLAEHLNIEINIGRLSWNTAPSLLTSTTLCCFLAKKSLYLGGTSRSAKLSDFGDISHTFYLPHVDIFRADGFITSMISEANLPFETEVVGNLKELLAAINRRLIQTQ